MTPAVDALTAAGIAHELHRFDDLDVDRDRILKTLVVDTGDGLAVALVPIDGSLDLKALAGVLGVKRVALAEPATAERATGYVVGGISPVGQRTALPTVVDAGALEHGTVFCSAGKRGWELELAPGDLVAAADARTARVSWPG